MSMVLCADCSSLFDSDDDPECFVETGNMRRLHQTTILCSFCRDARIEREEWEASRE